MSGSAPKKFFISFIFAASMFLVPLAHGATIEFVPETVTTDVGREFSVSVIIDSEEQGVNAAQGTIHFPPDILEIVSATKEDSVFSFWVQEPTISNTEGTLRFLGGTTKGISGSSLHLFRAVFRVKNGGAARITISDGAVTASDGKGTNVLRETRSLNVQIGAGAVAPAPPAEAPQRVVRPPVTARELPVKPTLRVPLYPDESRWYNAARETNVFWEVPADVTGVAIAVDQKPGTIPTALEKELFTGKNIGVLNQGVNYVHVRFRNALGFGPTTHYRIKIDTVAPLPFEIEMESAASDDPAPYIRFSSVDALSGVQGSYITIDGLPLPFTTSTEMRLPVQLPGRHRIVVKIVDEAGNSVEDDHEFEIVPLPEPVVEFFTEEVSQGEPIFVKVQTIPNATVIGEVLNEKKESIFQAETMSNELGDAELVVNALLSYGRYDLRITVRDERGATSVPKEVGPVRARAKIVFSIGFIDLGWFEIFLLTLFAVLAGGGALWFYYASVARRRGRYRLIVGRDIQKFKAMFEDTLKEIEKLKEGDEEEQRTKRQYFIDKMKTIIERMGKYLDEEIGRLE